jgi:hypothetical protein
MSVTPSRSSQLKSIGSERTTKTTTTASMFFSPKQRAYIGRRLRPKVHIQSIFVVSLTLLERLDSKLKFLFEISYSRMKLNSSVYNLLPVCETWCLVRRQCDYRSVYRNSDFCVTPCRATLRDTPIGLFQIESRGIVQHGAAQKSLFMYRVARFFQCNIPKQEKIYHMTTKCTKWP